MHLTVAQEMDSLLIFKRCYGSLIFLLTFWDMSGVSARTLSSTEFGSCVMQRTNLNGDSKAGRFLESVKIQKY